MADNVPELQLMIHFINNIREFNGKNSAELPDFIRQVENLSPTMERFSAANKAILFDFILARCTGITIHAIHNEGNINTWVALKNLLKSKFGEKSSLTELVDELKTTQINGTIEQFYHKIQKLCNRINIRRLTHNDLAYTAQEIQRISLRVFKEHIPEPAKSILIARNPDNIDEAYNITVEARYQNLTKHTPYNVTTRMNFSDNNSHRNARPEIRTNNYYPRQNNGRYTNYNEVNNDYNRNRPFNTDYYNRRNHNYNNYNNNNRDNNYNNNNRDNNYNNNNRDNNYNEGNADRNDYNRNRTFNTDHNNRNNYNNNNNNNNINRGQNNNHLNGNQSGNTRRTNNFNNGSAQTRRTNNVEPMEIGHLDSNYYTKRQAQLPYIKIIRNRPFYFLIDTGAEVSIVKEGVIPSKFGKNISTSIKALGRIHKINTSYEIPLFKEFGKPNSTMEFLEQNLHNNFDGLIGNNILSKLKCTIDYHRQILKTPECEIPFFINKEEEIYQEKLTNEVYPYVANFILEENNNYKINENLNGSEKNKLLDVINKYNDIFYNENSDLSFTNNVKHCINTINDIPTYSKMYKYPQIHEKEVEKQIEEMLKQKIIQHSVSPYNSPIWIVPKKLDNSNIQKWRIVIDFRKLNEVTINDRYPIPVIDDILGKLGRAQYFTTLDLAKGFHQIEVHPDDIHKTAFSTSNGHYEFLRMPFGLKNAQATFQRMINTVLKEYINKLCLVYMDDIIVFSTSIEEHIRRVFLLFYTR